MCVCVCFFGGWLQLTQHKTKTKNKCNTNHKSENKELQSRINFRMQAVSNDLWQKICHKKLQYNPKTSALNVGFQAFYIHLFAVIATQKGFLSFVFYFLLSNF